MDKLLPDIWRLTPPFDMLKPSTVIVLLALLGLSVGCRSVMERRISAHADTWRQLSEQDQRRLLRGMLRDGDTEEMARIALGPPDKVLPATGTNGEAQTVWVYDILEADNRGSEFNTEQVGYLRMPGDERRITFQNGFVMNRARDGTDIRQKMAAFRAKYNLPEHFRITNPVQIEELRTIFGFPVPPERFQ